MAVEGVCTWLSATSVAGRSEAFSVLGVGRPFGLGADSRHQTVGHRIKR
jgi:hypothetical protein